LGLFYKAGGERDTRHPVFFLIERKASMDYVWTKDRRASLRFPISLSVQCFDRQSRTEILSQTYDISAQGIGLLINEEIPLGAPVTVTITMPDTGEEIKVNGKFIWQKAVDSYCYRIGVELTGSRLKPIPIALRTLQARAAYH
jgi:hypothetical protein